MAALERGADLNEPIYHLCSEIGGNIMSLERIIDSGHRKLFRDGFAIR